MQNDAQSVIPSPPRPAEPRQLEALYTCARLRSLTIKGSVIAAMDVPAHGWPALTKMVIAAPAVKSIRIGKGAVAKLQRLDLSMCRGLETLAVDDGAAQAATGLVFGGSDEGGLGRTGGGGVEWWSGGVVREGW